jgi:hypothetical protein
LQKTTFTIDQFSLPPIQGSFREIPDDLSYEDVAAMLDSLDMSIEDAVAIAANLAELKPGLTIGEAMAMTANLSDEEIAAMLPEGVSKAAGMAIAASLPADMSMEEAMKWAADLIANSMVSFRKPPPSDLNGEGISALLPAGVSIKDALEFAEQLTPGLTIGHAIFEGSKMSEEDKDAMEEWGGMSLEDALAIASIFPPGMSIDHAMDLASGASNDEIANAMASIPEGFNLDDIQDLKPEFNPDDFNSFSDLNMG